MFFDSLEATVTAVTGTRDMAQGLAPVLTESVQNLSSRLPEAPTEAITQKFGDLSAGYVATERERVDFQSLVGRGPSGNTGRNA